ncbi:ABC transporter [Desulfuribacillus stibiiarsenatis]|uniref:ABC transporter n=1 Tax=Desulfuribacillus stibiiarsenatis TaxID=1390249 RepID=A0A1E5L993_9FIRM|nr:FtsX-like permease family protein [Desulfuribacillus stibiiarsenatis]OEH86701.1 ABC transporter [Desulfuribacillus stibiiarsenatis]
MHSRDLLRMAVGNLIRRKARSLLTILGVVIGTASIVIMLSLGFAMDQSFKEQLSYMGDLTVIEIHNYGYVEPGQKQSQSPKLDDQAVASLRKIDGVKGVMPIKTAYMKMGAGRMIGHVSIIGIDPDVMEAFDFKVSDGRLLMATDKDAIVFGKNIPYNFYNPRLRNQHYGWMGGGQPLSIDLMTSKLLITSDMNYGEPRSNFNNDGNENIQPGKTYDVKAVGMLAESFSEKDHNVYMHIDTLEKIQAEDRRNQKQQDRNMNPQNDNKYERISVKVEDFTLVEGVQEIIKSMGFQSHSLTDILKSMKETSRKMQAILGGIGGVSLFVAAIGITNTMIMSIYERTREIGVMKVIGADLDDIKKMFLIEAGFIGFFGGLLGVAFSYGVSMILNTVGSSMMGPMGPGGSTTGLSVIPIELSLVAIVFATFIGLIAGYSPARRAMNISALDAIRTDK